MHEMRNRKSFDGDDTFTICLTVKIVATAGTFAPHNEIHRSVIQLVVIFLLFTLLLTFFLINQCKLGTILYFVGKQRGGSEG